jgi:NADH-quinone oxidoreductase subunit J
MFSIAALFAILGAYFLAVIQILVYAGSIVVLFLFVIMLLDLDKETADRFKIFTRKGAVLFLILILVAELVLLLARSYIPVAESGTPLEGSIIEQIGALLFSKYIIPFELTSFLILAAIIAAVTLAKQEK